MAQAHDGTSIHGRRSGRATAVARPAIVYGATRPSTPMRMIEARVVPGLMGKHCYIPCIHRRMAEGRSATTERVSFLFSSQYVHICHACPVFGSVCDQLRQVALKLRSKLPELLYCRAVVINNVRIRGDPNEKLRKRYIDGFVCE